MLLSKWLTGLVFGSLVHYGGLKVCIRRMSVYIPKRHPVCVEIRTKIGGEYIVHGHMANPISVQVYWYCR